MIKRPEAGEYAAYADAYVSMLSVGADVLQILAETQQSTYDLLAHLTEEKAMYAYAEGKWTIKEVLGHMIDTERVFAFRAFCFSRAFAELPGFDQDEYVNNTNYNSHSIKSLAEEFRITRQSNLYMFRSLTEEQQIRKGIASGQSVTVRALVYLTAGHELYHLRILKEKYL